MPMENKLEEKYIMSSQENRAHIRTFPVDAHDLPLQGQRWTPRRKVAVIEAVQWGVISLEKVFVQYSISAEEFAKWKSDYRFAGQNGLRVTVKKNRLTAA